MGISVPKRASLFKDNILVTELETTSWAKSWQSCIGIFTIRHSVIGAKMGDVTTEVIDVERGIRTCQFPDCKKDAVKLIKRTKTFLNKSRTSKTHFCMEHYNFMIEHGLEV